MNYRANWAIVDTKKRTVQLYDDEPSHSIHKEELVYDVFITIVDGRLHLMGKACLYYFAMSRTFDNNYVLVDDLPFVPNEDQCEYVYLGIIDWLRKKETKVLKKNGWIHIGDKPFSVVMNSFTLILNGQYL